MGKKDLGQYFTKKQLVAHSLELLDGKIHCASVIDPMCGSGNMLMAAQEFGAAAENITGIEIDGEAYETCRRALPDSNIVQSDIFDIDKLDGQLYQRTLVLANPPYVRYQKTSRDQKMSARTVREKLLYLIQKISGIPEEERKLLIQVTELYSGLSDLSVPSWILCMLLTQTKGHLLIILPETWKSREYSCEVLAAFLRLFHLEYVIEDVHKNWFEEAQVATNILIARKRERVNSLQEVSKQFYFMASLDENNEKIVEVTERKIINLFPYLMKNKKKVIQIDSSIEKLSYQEAFVERMKQECGILADSRQIVALPELGVKIGQGLRTGANRFFYVESCGKADGFERVRMDRCWEREDLLVDEKMLRTVIRYQNELQGRLSTQGTSRKERVLFLQETAERGTDLGNYIQHAESHRVNIKGKPQYIPELSAVSPNARGGRQWYMLPQFQERHIPDLFVPRVNSEAVFFYENYYKDVIDANFSTLTLEKEELKYAVLAVLNSGWTRLQLEMDATVMGGGALKVEAVHLKRIMLPVLGQAELEKMDEYGRRLCRTETDGDEIRRQIDAMILQKIASALPVEDGLKILDTQIKKREEKRSH